MIKNKLDLKLINALLIAIICYLIYQTKTLWLDILNKIISILIPLIISFSLAYAIYPIINYLNKYKIPKAFGIFLVLILILIILSIIIILLIPILSSQIGGLLDYVILFIENINLENNLLVQIITELTQNLSSNIYKTINISISVITNLSVILILSVYFLIYMEKIRINFKKILSLNIYNYFKMLDIEMTKYISGFLKIVVISFFEYGFTYFIIGHPNALLLGFLSAISNFIPYFGGLIVQIIAVITALVISETLGLKIFLITLILGLIDSYIINPFVYGKTNELHPLIVIISVFIFGILFGFIGIIISIPLTIIIINTIKFYKENR